MPLRPSFARARVAAFRACVAGLALGLAASASAQPAGSLVPKRGFYAGLGGGYAWSTFGTQDLYAIGTSEIYQGATLVATGYAAGPGSVRMPDESNAAPSIQGGWLQHFDRSDWLWGAKVAYQYLDTPSSKGPIDLPQFGTFTIVSTGETRPFFGNAVARDLRTAIEHQVALIPYFGRSFERGFLYAGAGATWSRTKTHIDDLVGFAHIEGQHVNVSGAPQSFSASGGVWGVAGVLGGTWFIDRSWFVDLTYLYARTQSKTYNYASSFENPDNPFGTTTGTLVGSSSGRVTTQSLMVTLNRMF